VRLAERFIEVGKEFADLTSAEYLHEVSIFVANCCLAVGKDRGFDKWNLEHLAALSVLSSIHCDAGSFLIDIANEERQQHEQK